MKKFIAFALIVSALGYVAASSGADNINARHAAIEAAIGN